MLPLQGIRILDLTRMVAGAYCSMILADLGAEVIKIEQPKVGDDTRQWGPPFIKGESVYFFCVNRNKKSLTLDLQKDKGKEIFRALVGKADVVLENFRTGTMEKYGLGYESLKTLKPDLVYCSITGFGLSGPYKNRPGTDPILQAMGGIFALVGEADGKPYRIALPIVDMSSGLYAHGAILAALIARSQDKQSHFIEISLLDNVLSLLLNLGSTYLNTGEVPKRQGNAHPSIVPFNVFEAKDRDVFLSASADSRWKKLCQTLELEAMIDDPRFSTIKARIEHRHELERLLQERLKEKTAGEWMERMDKTGEGTPFAPINTLDHVFQDPHVVSRDIVAEIEHPVTGKIRMVAPPVHYDGARCEVRMPPPRLGEHNGEVLSRLLGYDEAQVAELQKEGIL
ncbi:MAG: CoA transferase [Proteobacteria bacterium]|nr:CoA transferase [Pseudomonadota bacterium]MBU2228475.1 CoA transferase [Pseudomonadota bacterium]MBU2261392.1 CoA transferase [Pseudomonadota bacterium]